MAVLNLSETASRRLRKHLADHETPLRPSASAGPGSVMTTVIPVGLGSAP